MQEVDTSRTSPTGARRASAVIPILVILLLIWLAAVVTLAQLRMSPTFDEPNHVTRGIAILRTGDYRLSLDHPPLANVLEALPVAWRHSGFSPDLPAWRNEQTWRAARATVWSDPAAGLQLIRGARPMVLIFTLGLGLLIFLWAAALFGRWGGVLALALYALDPTMIAHGGLATTDMAAACTMLLAVFLLRGYLRRPSPGRLVLAGVGLGLALAAKFSMLILLPITALILLVIALRPAENVEYPIGWPAQRGRRFLRAAGAYAVILLVSGIVVWGMYGFTVEPLGAKPGQPLPVNASRMDRLPVPALQYLRGVKTVMTDTQGHRAYLLGKVDRTGKGWWYYFPVALAVKTPLPELLLMAGMLLLALLPKVRARLALAHGEWLLLLLPAGMYFLAALGVLGVSLNLGVRHIMPLFPFLLILAGGWVLLLRPRARGVVLGCLLAAQLAAVLFAFPDYIAYFNEPGRLLNVKQPVLIDSNYDWGQDLGRLAEFQRQANWGTVYFSYFGTAAPEAYGLSYHPLTGLGAMREAPPPDWSTMRGYLAISLTNLYGGEAYAGADYGRLLNHRPVRTVGKTIRVYRLPFADGSGGQAAAPEY
ncbi:MAG: ArnT family glycosyltransferase [Armatimonadota bacterium]